MLPRTTNTLNSFVDSGRETGVLTLDPALLTLRSELERLDYVVVPHGDHICVRLPLLSSVRIRYSGGRFRFTSQFGPFHRSGGLLTTSGASAAALATSALYFGPTVSLVVGFLGVVALAHDACRFVVTEGCLTRLQNIIAATKALPTGDVTDATSRNPLIGA